jgi:hypothetical protein
MGTERADAVVALQEALMRAARDFADAPAFQPLAERVLASAAALDYVLMLARGASGTRIAERDADRAIHDGIVRAVDDLILAADAIAGAGTPPGLAFAHETAKMLAEVVRDEALRTDARTFALIALANA